ncbi:RNA-directed DNA polymerase, eukaryota, reverse transcriptase zinc-binding domain protein [Tanacetum coccineum]
MSPLNDVLFIVQRRSIKLETFLSVIKGIHGNNEAIDNTITSHCGSSVWKGILKATARLKLKGVDLLEYCKIVNGNGNTFKFWHDKWLGDVHLKDKFNRCFNLDLQKDASIAFKLQSPDLTCSFRRQPRSGIEETQFLELSQLLSLVTLSPANNRWSWSLNGNGAFSVKSAREVIDKKVLVTSSSPTRWSTLIPIKTNVFLWRMFLNKLPTRTNLSNRGIDIPCILCPNCGNGVESRNHLFFECSLTVDLFQLLGHWWNIQVPSLSDPSSWETWFIGLRFSGIQKLTLEASCFSLKCDDLPALSDVERLPLAVTAHATDGNNDNFEMLDRRHSRVLRGLPLAYIHELLSQQFHVE